MQAQLHAQTDAAEAAARREAASEEVVRSLRARRSSRREL